MHVTAGAREDIRTLCTFRLKRMNLQASDVQKIPVDMTMVTAKAPSLAAYLKESVERCGSAHLTGVPAPVVESALRYVASRSKVTVSCPIYSGITQLFK